MVALVAMALMAQPVAKAPPTSDELALRLRHKTLAVRLQAATAAGSMGASLEQPAIRALVGLTKDADPKVRKAAVHSIGEVGPRARELGGGAKLGEVLAELTQDKDFAVRKSAIWSLGQIGIDDQGELRLMCGLLKDKAPEVRGLVIQAIGQYLHPETPADWRTLAQEELAVVLSDKDARVQKVAAEQLLACGAEVVPLMKRVVETDKGPGRVWAALVLGQLGPAAREALPALQKLLGEVPADRRLSIQQAIKKILS